MRWQKHVDMRTDLVAWVYGALRHLAPATPSRGHVECASLLMDVEHAAKDVAIMAFRGWGKSTWLSVAYPLHQALLVPETSILIASESADVAQDRLRAIRRELEGNAVVRGILPRPEGDPWGQTHLRLRNGSEIRAVGSGTQLRGRGEIRPHLVLLDDTEDPEKVKTEAGRRKHDDWVNMDIRPALNAKRGRLVEIGTPLHPDCHIQRVVHGEDGHGTEGWVTRRYPASTGRLATGRASWPAWWPLGKLETVLARLRQSKAGTRAYSQEYDLESVPDEAVVFDRGDFGKVGALKPAETKGMWVAMALDPAIGEDERNDYAAYCVLGVWRDGVNRGKAVVLEVARGRWGFDAMLTMGHALYRKWDCRYWGYEGTAFQRVIRPAILRMSREVWKHPIRLVQMEAASDKVSRAQGVQYLVEQGLVGWPHEEMAGGKMGRRLYPEAWEEITNFPEVAHDDQCDAFVYAMKMWELYWRKDRGQAPPRKEKIVASKAGGWQAETERELRKIGERKRLGLGGPRDLTGAF